MQVRSDRAKILGWPQIYSLILCRYFWVYTDFETVSPNSLLYGGGSFCLLIVTSSQIFAKRSTFADVKPALKSTTLGLVLISYTIHSIPDITLKNLAYFHQNFLADRFLQSISLWICTALKLTLSLICGILCLIPLWICTALKLIYTKTMIFLAWFPYEFALLSNHYQRGRYTQLTINTK